MVTVNVGQSVQWLQRVVTGQDDYGDDIYTMTTVTLDGCVISPGNTSEDINGTASVTSDVILHVPVRFGITGPGPFDRMILPDGNTYLIAGIPKAWQSPFTGTKSMIEIPLQLVTGAMQTSANSARAVT
jgi:hypothetical protein